MRIEKKRKERTIGRTAERREDVGERQQEKSRK
jgi:hypothetical protein